MSFNIVGLCTAIANITPASLGMTKVFDLNTTPDEIQERDCPCLWPNVNDGIWDVNEIQRISFGPGGTLSTDAKKNIAYLLRYRVCYAPSGAGRNALKTHIQKMATAMSTLITYFIANEDAVCSSGKVLEFHPMRVTQAGTVIDPSGKEFHGCDIVFYVLEFAEVHP